MSVQGLHHISIISANAQRTVDFYTQALGLRVTPVLDRIYFKSIYMNDPDGHILELATAGPGFVVDEEYEDLGQSLKLPPWLEKDREGIEGNLQPMTVPRWQAPEGFWSYGRE